MLHPSIIDSTGRLHTELFTVAGIKHYPVKFHPPNPFCLLTYKNSFTQGVVEI